MCVCMKDTFHRARKVAQMESAPALKKSKKICNLINLIFIKYALEIISDDKSKRSEYFRMTEREREELKSLKNAKIGIKGRVDKLLPINDYGSGELLCLIFAVECTSNT